MNMPSFQLHAIYMVSNYAQHVFSSVIVQVATLKRILKSARLGFASIIFKNLFVHEKNL